MSRKKASTKSSMKPCPVCLRNNRLDTAYTHSRSSNSLCPFNKMTRRQQLQQEIGRTTTVCRKIGLNSLISIDDDDRKQLLLGRRNELVGYVRDVVVKAPLFLTYYMYSKLNDQGVIRKQVFTKAFFYALFQLITSTNITINNIIGQQLAVDIQQSYRRLNPTDTQTRSFSVAKIHGNNGYSDVISSTLDKYSMLLDLSIELKVM